MKQLKKLSKSLNQEKTSPTINFKFVDRKIALKYSKTEKKQVKQIISKENIHNVVSKYGFSYPVYSDSISLEDIKEGMEVFSIYEKKPVKIVRIIPTSSSFEVEVDSKKNKYLYPNQIKLI